MEVKLKKAYLFILLIIAYGCSSEMESQVDLVSAFDFESGTQQWDGGVSDYPVYLEDSISYKVEADQVANSFSLAESIGLNISGENPHGDLFYYFKRKIGGLQPLKIYKLDFEFLIYTQLANDVKHDPPQDLFLKIGAVDFQPELEEVLWQNTENYKTLNLDKGESNSDEGKDMFNVGSLAKYTSQFPEVISGNTFDKGFEVSANKDGEIWILVGVDSGIEGNLVFGMEALTVYYTKIN